VKGIPDPPADPPGAAPAGVTADVPAGISVVVASRAFQNPGFSVESGIYPDISGYIRWNLLAIQCESKTEDTAGKLILCSSSSWED